MKRPKTIIGIDPGSTNGGIAMWKEGDPVKVLRMPKNDELDRLSDYFEHISSTENDVVVFIEEISMFLGSDDINNPAIQYRLQKLKANYDVIILDTPPVGLVTDGILAMKKAERRGSM